MNHRTKSTDFDYVYDNIGNVDYKALNGSTNDYTANNLNQYSDIDGTNLTYDLDGNLLSNNGWTYTWNGENRMIMASNSEHVISFKYDFQGRMFEKVIDGATNEYVWDDFNIIAEISSAHTNYNVWGLDLSGSLQGAGGVGGLLSVSVDSVVYYPSFDANGNITEYVSDDGTIVAHREYSAFGETINLTGDKKDDFTHWWSTKPWDALTGMSEYEYRKYLVGMGRWGSRDAIEELGAQAQRDPNGVQSDMERNNARLSKLLAQANFAQSVGWTDRANAMYEAISLLRKSQVVELSAGFMSDYHVYNFVQNNSINTLDILGLVCVNETHKIYDFTTGSTKTKKEPKSQWRFVGADEAGWNDVAGNEWVCHWERDITIKKVYDGTRHYCYIYFSMCSRPCAAPSISVRSDCGTSPIHKIISSRDETEPRMITAFSGVLDRGANGESLCKSWPYNPNY